MVQLLYAGMLSITVLALLLELGYSAISGRQLYSLKDSAANFVLYAGFIAINVAWAHLVFQAYVFASDHAIVQLPVGGWHLGNNGLWWEWLLLFILEDLCFYFFHRANHRVSIFWASHVTHHSSPFYNLSVAFRQTWVPFPSLLFWLPLPLLGFDPLMVMSVQVVSLFYQELLHTQAVPRLGPIEWIFNTPSHHALHHASNASYLDKNYGGVLILWDRLFGTFAKVGEQARFGLTKPLQSNNPVVIAFHGWIDLLQALWRKPSLRLLLRPPNDARGTE